MLLWLRDSEAMFTEYDVVDGEAFYIAIHVQPNHEADLLKNLATIPPLVHQLNEFRVMVMTFSGVIEQIGVFDETNIHDVLLLNGKPKSAGILFDTVAGVVMGDHMPFRLHGHPKVFVYCNEPLRTAWSPTTLAQMIDIRWLGSAGLPIGATAKPLDHSMIALREVFDALEPFVDIAFQEKDAVVTGKMPFTLHHFHKVDQAMRIARILTDKPA